jgi:hypothetical protein
MASFFNIVASPIEREIFGRKVIFSRLTVGDWEKLSTVLENKNNSLLREVLKTSPTAEVISLLNKKPDFNDLIHYATTVEGRTQVAFLSLSKNHKDITLQELKEISDFSQVMPNDLLFDVLSLNTDNEKKV